MILDGTYQFGLIIFFALIFNAIKFVFPKSKNVLTALLVVGNLVVLQTIIQPFTLTVLLLISGAVYFTAMSIARNKKRELLVLSITVLVVLFSIRNYPSLQNILNSLLPNFKWEAMPIMSVSDYPIYSSGSYTF